MKNLNKSMIATVVLGLFMGQTHALNTVQRGVPLVRSCVAIARGFKTTSPAQKTLDDVISEMSIFLVNQTRDNFAKAVREDEAPSKTTFPSDKKTMDRALVATAESMAADAFNRYKKLTQLDPAQRVDYFKNRNNTSGSKLKIALEDLIIDLVKTELKKEKK